MKSFMKKFLFLMILMFGSLFLGDINAYASAVNWYGVKIECIYTDGGAYTFSYIKTGSGETDYKSSMNRTTYNLAGVSNMESGTTSSIEYVNKMISDNKCKSHLRTGTVTEEDDDGNNQSTTYYKFANSSSGTAFEEDDFDEDNWWDRFWSGSLSAEDKLEMAEDTDEKYYLVSERYIVTELAGEPDFTLTYKADSEQATGSDSYVWLMNYDGTYFLKTKEKTTLLGAGTSHFSGVSVNSEGDASGLNDNDVIYVNSPEAMSTTESTGVVSYYYNYGQVRYGISTSQSGDYTRKYVLFNTGLGTGDAPGTVLCDDIMPETSKVLKKVIQITQILTPVLMIGLCALDIGKIVIAGNIEEDLPKQRKKIITRLVVGIVVFFLPIIVIAVLDILKDTGAVNANEILDIQCLFE